MSQFSSGDVITDRRADYARMLADGRDFAAAAELMEQALELAPAWAAGWFGLGEYREKAGLATAEDAYRQALKLDPQDVFGATLKLAVIGAERAPEQPPSRYVEGLFDNYAARFDTSLVEKLGYSLPGKLAEIVAPHADFALAVDLGCGTGLMGAELRPMTRRLEGFDISANMLSKAQDKGLYDHLGQADLNVPAWEGGLFGQGRNPHRADLVTSADVMMYLGALDTVVSLADALLAPGGLFAYSVEDSGEAEGFILRDSLRYAHSEAYNRALLADHGLDVLEMRRSTLRLDAGKPVPGILFLSRKPG